jgi:hypothetical protein
MFWKNKEKMRAKMRESWGESRSDGVGFGLIDKYHSLQPAAYGPYRLNEQTCTDLDFEDFFRFCDHTTSAPGRQYLYHRLRMGEYDENKARTREQWLIEWASEESLRTDLRLTLSRLTKVEDYYLPNLLFEEPPPAFSPIWLVRLLQGATLGVLAASVFQPGFVLALVAIFPVALFVHYRNKSLMGGYLNTLLVLPRLPVTVKELLKRLPKTDRRFEVDTARRRIKAFSEKKIAILESEKLQDGNFSGLGWYLIELLKIPFFLEVSIYHGIVNQLKLYRDDVDILFTFIGEIDISLSIASLRAATPKHCLPNFKRPAKTFACRELYHPFVTNCVPNDLTLDRRSLLLTGSNMSGKSTFVRSVNLNALAAQTLNTVFAESYESPPFAIMTSIRITDDLAEGSSYFMEEVTSIGRLLEAARADGIARLFTIDEVFKGTNTIERIAAAKAILEYLALAGEHLVLVSTHDLELTELLTETYTLHHFQESIADRQLSFDYKLRPGPLTKRNAIGLLEIAGFPATVVAEARRLAGG